MNSGLGGVVSLLHHRERAIKLRLDTSMPAARVLCITVWLDGFLYQGREDRTINSNGATQ